MLEVGEIAVYPRLVHYLHHFVLACHLVGLSLLRKRSASPFGCSFVAIIQKLIWLNVVLRR